MRYLVCVGLLILSPFSSARADDASPDQKCDSVLCVLMPVYRIGKTLLNLEPKSTALPLPSPEASHDIPAPTTDASPPSRPDDVTQKPTFAQTSTKNKIPEQEDKTETRPQISEMSWHSRQASSKHNKLLMKKIVASRAVAPRQLRQDVVSIGADGPDLQRIKSLSAIIDSPHINIVEGVFDSCRGEPVDFRVDALQNPMRRGLAIPLYDENLIILAGNRIESIAGLKRKKVSFGQLGGASDSIARLVFKALNIQIEETPLDFENALDGLDQGAIDAVAFLVPRGSNEFASFGSRFHILAVPESLTSLDGMRTSLINPSSYLGAMWSKNLVRVPTVDAVLSPNTAGRHAGSAPLLFASLDRNSARLAQSGFDLVGGDRMLTMRSAAEVFNTLPIEKKAVSRCGMQNQRVNKVDLRPD